MNFREIGDTKSSVTKIVRDLNYAFKEIVSPLENSFISYTTNLVLNSTTQGYILFNSTSAVTINLPAANVSTSKRYYFHNANTGTVTINPIGSDTLDGSTSFDLYQYESLNIFSNGSNWYEGG